MVFGMDKKENKGISIRWQLMIISILLVSVPVITLGFISYQTSKTQTLMEIEDSLVAQMMAFEEYVEATQSSVETREESIYHQAESVVEAQAKSIFEFINSYTGTEEDLKNIISRIPVGQTGYIYALDYNGNYVISKDRSRDGDNILGAKDANGVEFIKEIISKGKKLSGSEIDYQIYPWKNAGEDVARDKVAALLSDPYRDWVYGVGTYYDELADFTFIEQAKIDIMTVLSHPVIGKTGYIYVLTGDGMSLMSSDGIKEEPTNAWDSKDAHGGLYIQEMIKIAKANPHEMQILSYERQTDSGIKPRINVYYYDEHYDWVVGAGAYTEEFFDGLIKLRTATIIISIIAILIGSIVAYFFAVSISKPLGHVQRVIKRVADGDLSQTVELKSNILELNDVSINFDTMVDKIKNLIIRIKESSDETAASSEQLSASSEEVNASMEQVSSTIQEIAKGAQVVSQRSGEAETASKNTAESAKKGSDSASSVNEKMSVISTSTKEGATKIKTLGEKSKEIGNIVETINGISEQTNLLALNAAIEAARAGDAGRGFAVVADEVRKLAEETGNATKQISDLIGGIQSEIQASVETMDKNTVQVEEGASAVNTALKAFEEIPELIGKVNTSIGDMAAVAQENAAGSEEVSSSIEQVTSAMQQVATSSQTLSDAAVDLKKLIMEFKVDDSNNPESDNSSKKELTPEEIEKYEKEAEKILSK